MSRGAKKRRVTKVTLDGFRGGSVPSTFSLPEDKGFVLIFGENGTGKSSIVDALDCCLNGTIGSLENVSLGSGTKFKFLGTLGKALSAVRSEVEIGGELWSAGVQSTRINRNPGPTQTSLQVLRRRDLIRLVEAPAAQRYKELAPFFGIDAYVKGEEALKECCRSLEKSVNELRNRRVGAETTIKGLWERADGASGAFADHMDWAKDRVKVKREDIELQGSQAQDALDKLALAVNAGGQTQRTAAELASAETALERALENPPSIDSDNESDSLQKLVAVLVPAQEYVAALPNLTECPVCEQSIDRAVLQPELNQRIESLDRFVAYGQRTAGAERALALARGVHSNAVSSLVKQCQEVAGCLSLGTTLPPHIRELSVALGETNEESQCHEWLAMLTPHRETLQERRDTAYNLASELDNLQTSLEQVAKSQVELEAAAKIHDRAEQGLKIVTEERKALVQSILTELSADIRETYKALHPDEPIQSGEITLDEAQSASLLHSVLFCEEVVPPGAYLSESHIDTLGFAIFLAMAKRAGPETIVVLDDIFTSVDNAHMKRAVNVIVDLSSQLAQVILTTHSRRLAQAFSMHAGATNLTHRVHLLGWSMETGIRVRGTPTECERLKKALDDDDFDRQAVAGKAGPLLEHLFGHLDRQYRCAFAEDEDGKSTLYDLSQPFKKTALVMRAERGRLNSKKEFEVYEEVIVKPLAQKLFEHDFVRNDVGAHWSETGQDHPDAEVRAFGEAALGLVEALVCPQCGSLPIRRKPDYRVCHCGLTRYHPVDKI